MFGILAITPHPPDLVQGDLGIATLFDQSASLHPELLSILNGIPIRRSQLHTIQPFIMIACGIPPKFEVMRGLHSMISAKIGHHIQLKTGMHDTVTSDSRTRHRITGFAESSQDIPPTRCSYPP